MKPVEYEHANDVLLPPVYMPNVISLPVAKMIYADGVKGVESCWELSEEELQDIIKTRRVYLVVLSHTHPPVILNAKSEFDREVE